MVQGIVDVCISLLEWLISLIPKVNFFEGFASAVSGIYAILYEASVIIPFSDLFICIGAISSFYVSLFAIKCINWIVHRVPFLN